MLPEPTSAGASGDVFSDAESSPSSDASNASAEDSAENSPAGADSEGNEGDESSDAGLAGDMAGDTTDSAPPGDAGAGGDPSSAALEAARTALEEAGMAIGTAADAVSSAASEEEMTAAEDALANARVAIIIAGQDLAQARQVLSESGAQGREASEAGIEAAEDALANATVAIVVATGVIMDAGAGFPDEGQRLPSGGVLTNNPGTGAGSELDAELEASLIIFDGRIEDSRQAVLESDAPSTRTGLPARTPRTQGDQGGNSDDATDMAANADMAGEDRAETDAKSSGMGRGATQAAKASGNADMVPDDINDGQNDDIVAQQLREAALAETDPTLREKLWEEYRRYKSGQ